MRMRLARWTRRLALGAWAILPLVVWPGLARPFSLPKRWWLALAVVVLLPLAAAVAACRPASPGQAPGYGRVPRWFSILCIGWLASWALSSLAGDFVSRRQLGLAVSAALWALVLVLVRLPGRALLVTQQVSAVVVAGVAIAQWAGADPFAAAGWHLPLDDSLSARLRVYGTLGNPNFVAAYLALAVPGGLALSTRTANHARGASRPGAPRALRPAGPWWLTLAAQVLGIAATGSRAGALGLAAGVLVWSVFTPGARRQTFVAGAGISLCLVAISAARPLDDTLAGRLYIWRIAAPHAFERPVAGLGPGAFETMYLSWEAAAWRSGRALAHDRRFAGGQPHAHNEYLQTAVERGLGGLAALLGLLVVPLWYAWRRDLDQDTLVGGAAAGMLAAAAAMMTVDCIMLRPTEAAAIWTAVALVAAARADAG